MVTHLRPSFVSLYKGVFFICVAVWLKGWHVVVQYTTTSNHKLIKGLKIQFIQTLGVYRNLWISRCALLKRCSTRTLGLMINGEVLRLIDFRFDYIWLRICILIYLDKFSSLFIILLHEISKSHITLKISLIVQTFSDTIF